MELLTLLWGDAPGQRVLLYKRGGDKSKNGGRNAFFADNESASEFARTKNAAGFDVWFACALFGDLHNRKQTNALSVKSFWLDLDVDPTDEKKYATIETAASSLASFCDSLQLPLPNLVCSGTGLHAHWILDIRIDRERWEVSAKALKTACTRLGLHADPSRTADVASVLRIPGTKHLKEPTTPLDVEVIGEIQPVVSVVEFEAQVARYINVDKTRQANKVFDTSVPDLPVDAEKITERCAVMKEVRDKRGDVEEPLWYGAIGVLTHCIDGERLAHEWSKGYEGYSEEETQARYDRASAYGPTLCATFATHRTALCAACPSRTVVTTPYRLGLTTSPVRVPLQILPDQGHDVSVAVQPDTVQPLDEWTAPKPYRIGKEGVFYYDEEADKFVAIFTVPVRVFDISAAPNGEGRNVTIQAINNLGDLISEQVPQRLIGDQREMRSWLDGHGLSYFNPEKMVMVTTYLRACVNEWQNSHRAAVAYQHFGLTRDGCVIGRQVVTAEGYRTAILGQRAANSDMGHETEGLVCKGTLAGWVDATKLISDQPRFNMHRFTVMAALGSFFLGASMMNVGGGVLSLAGGSGAGKTAAALLGCSAFGHPNAFMVSTQSSLKSFWEIWAVAHHLPVVIEEASDLKNDYLATLIYAAANGKARVVLNRSGILRVTRNWRLLTIATSNHKMLDLDEKVLNTANRVRIFEIDVPKEGWELGEERAATLYNAISENHGHAGHIFLRHIITNREQVQADAMAMRKQYDIKGIPEVMRYRRWIIAAAHLAGRIALKTNLIHFDPDQTSEWAVDVLKSQIAGQATNLERASAAYAEFCALHVNHWSHFYVKGGTQKLEGWNLQGERIMGECAGRITHEKDGSRTHIISSAKYRIFARERDIDKHELNEWLKHMKAWTDTGWLTAESRMQCFHLPIKDETDGN
jgi:hypothetical protein